MCNMKIKVMGGLFNQDTSQQLNSIVEVGNIPKRTVTELIFRSHGIGCDQISEWEWEDQFYTTVLKTKGAVLDQLEKSFYKEDLFRGASIMEAYINADEKIGYKRFTRTGKIAWFIEKNRPDLLERLKDDIVLREAVSDYTTLSTVERVADLYPSPYEETFSFKEYQFYKWDNYVSSEMTNLINNVTAFSQQTFGK